MASRKITWPKFFILFSIFSLGYFSWLEQAAFARDLRVALVFDKGGKDDRSFNSAAYRGAMKAKDELKSFIKYVEATDDNSFEPFLRSFAQKDFDLIIGVGISRQTRLRRLQFNFLKSIL